MRSATFSYMLDNAALQNRQRSLTFSDNTIVGVPEPTDEAFIVGCFSAASYQLGMTLKGVAYRGGIAHGPLYVGRSLAHGSALMEAVHLEQVTARYPRVVLSNRLRARARGMATTQAPEGSNEDIVRELIAVDEDLEYFVDYLGALSHFSTYVEYGLDSFEQVLIRHAEVIEEALAAGDAREKWPWIADYDNSVVTRQGGTGRMVDAARVKADGDARAMTSWHAP